MIRMLLLLLFPLPLWAQTGATAMFPPEATCFQRHYDVAHLSKHPQQQVSDIALTPAAGQDVSAALMVNISVKLQGQTAAYTASAYCEAGSVGLACKIGDAGAFTLTLRDDGALLLKVDPLGVSLEGEQAFLMISGSSGDDREFLMQPVAAADCF